MKRLILIGMVSVLLSACASTQPRIVSPVPPATEKAMKSNYRKTQEVMLVACQQRDIYVRLNNSTGYNHSVRTVKDKEEISIVETTDTGERFEVHGCYGQVGDRFKISY